MKIYRSWRVLSTGLKPSALADNPLDLHNSSYHTQPRAIIAQYLYSLEFKAAQAKSLDFWLIYSN